MSKNLHQLEKCPACDSSTSHAQRLFTVFLWGEACDVLKCGFCGLVFKNLAPDKKGLEELYSSEYVHFNTPLTVDKAEINSAREKLSRCMKVLEECNPVSEVRLLDIGCGTGCFVDLALNMGYIAEGIDPYLPENLVNRYLTKRRPEDVQEKSYDIVVLLNVVEHLVDPIKMFDAVRRILKPGGVMLLTCPYGDSFARYFYKDKWVHLARDEHLLFWNPRSLTGVLRRLGFKGRISYRISGSPFPYGFVSSDTNDTRVTMTNSYANANGGQVRQKSLQSRVWELARAIQRREGFSNFVRTLIHLTRSGDYLEYAISLGK